MERTRKKLMPGVELIIDRTEQFKTGLFSVTLTVPMREESATLNALIPDVLYRGSRRHPDIQSLCEATDELFGAALGPVVRQRGESQCVSFLCSFIDDRYALDGMAVLEPAIRLTGEVLLDPVTENGIFLRSYVESEGANLADRIRSRVNDKRAWATFRMIQEMCRGEAYALDKFGSAEEAERVTAEILWEAYQRLIGEAQVVFYYCGSADILRVETAVRHSFASLISARSEQFKCVVLARPRDEVHYVVERMDVSQGKLLLGFRTGGVIMGGGLYPALLVMNALYGGTSHSKLFMNVRERLGLCYHISSQLDKLKGIMAVASGIEFCDRDLAEQEILAQLDAIRGGEFLQEELEAAIHAVVSALMGQKDCQSQMEDNCVTQVLAGGEICGPETLIRAVKGVTSKDVAHVADLIRLDTVYYLTGKGADEE